MGTGKPRNDSFFSRLLARVSFGASAGPESYQDVLSQPGDPFRFVVKEFLPASAAAKAHVVDRDGAPMVRIGLQFKGPSMPQAQDAFRSEDEHWLATEKRFYRVVRSQPPAMIMFSYVNRPELVDDFLKPPFAAVPAASPGSAIRIEPAVSRSFDWVLDDQKGKSIGPSGERPDRHAFGGRRVSDEHRAARSIPG